MLARFLFSPRSRGDALTEFGITFVTMLPESFFGTASPAFSYSEMDCEPIRIAATSHRPSAV